MKRSIALILTLICLLMLSPGCIGSHEEALPMSSPQAEMPITGSEKCMTRLPDGGYCFDYRYTSIGAIISEPTIFETDDAVYFLCRGRLYISDKQYKEFIPLCAKPNCDHDNEDCSAMLGENVTSFWIYDKYIYYIWDGLGPDESAAVTHPVLYRMGLDGYDHEKVIQLPEHQVDYTPGFCSWSYIFSNKYLFVTHSLAKTTPAMGGKLDTGSFIITLDDLNAKAVDTAGLGFPVYGRGSQLFCFGTEKSGERNYVPFFSVYDFETDEFRRIGEAEGWIDVYDGGNAVAGDKVVYLDWDQQNHIISLHAMDIETGENELLATGNEYKVKWLVFDWSTQTLFRSYLGRNDGPEEETRPNWGLYVCDLNGNELVKSLYEDLPEDFFEARLTYQTDNYIFAVPPDDEGSFGTALTLPTWYIDKSEMGTENFGWRRWAPEG